MKIEIRHKRRGKKGSMQELSASLLARLTSGGEKHHTRPNFFSKRVEVQHGNDNIHFPAQRTKR